MDRFTLSANTLSKTVKDNLADRIEVEIGDSKQLDFKPQFKIKRWDNEVNFSMRAQEEAGATMVEEDGKVKYKGKDIEVHQYEKPDAGEDGGYEFEWVLKKKPKSNVLRTTIQHKGLDFFYQPEINDAEAQASSFKGDRRTLTEIKREMRPENVVGSYAVYHKTKRDNRPDKHYKTGKAFHIYRPHAVDADGVEVWCDLDITDGELTVTVPEDFLNKASYPVVVDPTFGYTSGGASSTSPTHNALQGSEFAGVNGTIEKLTFRAYNFDTDFFDYSEAGDFKGFILSDTETIISNGISGTVTSSFRFDWYDVVFGTEPDVLDSENYILAVMGTALNAPPATRANNFQINFDVGNANQGLSEDTGDNNFASPTDPTSATRNTNKLSIYATYTAAAPSYNPAFAHRRLLL